MQTQSLCPRNMLQGSCKPIMFKILKLEKKIKHGCVEKCYTNVREMGMTPTKNVK